MKEAPSTPWTSWFEGAGRLTFAGAGLIAIEEPRCPNMKLY